MPEIISAGTKSISNLKRPPIVFNFLNIILRSTFFEVKQDLFATTLYSSQYWYILLISN